MKSNVPTYIICDKNDYEGPREINTCKETLH